MGRSLSYLKAVVICHGKSEKQLCDFIKSNLRIRIAVESDKKGEKSIQITSVMNTLNGKKFKTMAGFMREFSDVEIRKIKTKKYLTEEFKVFIIMDTDDCTDKQKNDYINKEMFRNHWLYPYIVPIFNSPNLENILEKAKIKFEKKGKERKKEYIKIFPTDSKYKNNEMIQIKDFCENLKKVNNTNMGEFINFCIELTKYQK